MTNDVRTPHELDYRSMFLWGAVGGTLPTLGRIAGTYAANFEAPAPAWLGVFLALSLYAFIGAVIARAMGNGEMKQALIAGIAAPAIITNVFNGVSEGRIRVGDLSLFGVAHAQQASFVLLARRTVTVDPHFYGYYGSYSPKSPYRVAIAAKSTRDGVPLWTGTYNLSPYKYTFTVPGEARGLSFNGKWIEIPATTTDVEVDLDVKAKPSVGSDFLWALGALRQLPVQDIVPKLDTNDKQVDR
jgi:hypothetical protein